MRTSPLLADFIHARGCKPICAKLLTLPAMVWEYLRAVRDSRVKEREKLVKLQKMWALRKPVLDTHILLLQEQIQKLEQEIDDISMEYLKSRNA